MTKQELKTPDKIWLASKSFFDWAAEQWLVLAIFLGLIFVGTLGFSIYKGISTQTETKAQYHYAKAKALYEQRVIGAPGEAQKTKEDLAKELSILEKEFGGTRTNQIANLMRGHLALDEGDSAKALQLFESYAKALPSAAKDIGLYPAAVAKEQAGQFEAALKDFSAIAKVEDSAFRELAYLGKARSERALKKNADALKTYQEFLEKFPSSMEVGRVRGLMSLVKSETP